MTGVRKIELVIVAVVAAEVAATMAEISSTSREGARERYNAML